MTEGMSENERLAAMKTFDPAVHGKEQVNMTQYRAWQNSLPLKTRLKTTVSHVAFMGRSI